MDTWLSTFRALIDSLGTIPELTALVCLFVINNALWMLHLSRSGDGVQKGLWQLVQQMSVLTTEVRDLRELAEFQIDLYHGES